MAIKIAISLTALSLIQIGMADVWDKKVVRLMSGKTDRRITFYPSSLLHYRPMASDEGWSIRNLPLFSVWSV